MTCILPDKADRLLLVTTAFDFGGIHKHRVWILGGLIGCKRTLTASSIYTDKSKDGYSVILEFEDSIAEKDGEVTMWAEAPRQQLKYKGRTYIARHKRIYIEDHPENASGFIHFNKWKLKALA